MKEEDVIAFARKSFASLWELDLLLLLHGSQDRIWAAETAVVALRASRDAIDQAVRKLQALKFVTVLDDGRISYALKEGPHEEAVEALARLWKEKPYSVIAAIYEAQAGPLKNFSDAFKLKE